MPRGNDQEQALHELADKFGSGVGTAEQLIDANLAANTQALRKAQILPVDHEATAEARKGLSDIKGPNGEPAVAVAVRGSAESEERYTVVVLRSEDGRDTLYALEDEGEAVGPPNLGGTVGRSAPDVEVEENPKVLIEEEQAKAAEGEAKADDKADDKAEKPAATHRSPRSS